MLRADGTAGYPPIVGGQLVGALYDATFATVRVHLSPGDSLLLYTDGLTEARGDGPAGRHGEDALINFATKLAPSGASNGVTAVTEVLKTTSLCRSPLTGLPKMMGTHSAFGV